MQEINTSDKRFTDGNGRDRMGTVVTAAWLNGVQDELVGLVRGLGGTPAPQTPNQIWQLLQTALNGKAPSQHGHQIADITGLQAALNDKAPSQHGHQIAAINGLQAALNSKFNAAGGDIGGRIRLRYSSSSKWVGMVVDNTARGQNIYWDAESAGTPVGGFQIVSEGAADGEYRAVINITPPGNPQQNRRRSGMVIAHDHIDTAAYGRLDQYFAGKSELNGKANSSHTHPISDIVGLQTALDNKISKTGTDNIGGQKTFTGSVRVPTAATGSNDTTAASTAFVQAAVSQAVPSGTIAWFAGSNAPAGWLKANGASVSRSTYAALFAAIGTTYGGSGNNFNLPDLRGEFIRGWDNGRNIDQGRALGSTQAHNMPDHHHGIGFGDQANDGYFLKGEWQAARGDYFFQVPGEGSYIRTNVSDLQVSKNNPLSTAKPHGINGENRPRNIALLACIKI